MERIRFKKTRNRPFFKELKSILEEYLQDNPYMSFSYYELRDYIITNFQDISNSSIILRIKELQNEAKVSITECTYKKSRYEIRWSG